ncbi:MAG: Crp/Fnr family transcriptional regulator [bacterium]|nr:Crp/Fnr family transcriptional regulator [bacterium]
MMKSEIYEVLSRSPVFKGMKPLEIQEGLQRVQHRFIKHKKGKMIAFRGDRCESLMVLIKGSVRAGMADFSGKSIEVETVSAPRPIAPAFIFGKKNVFPVDVEVDRDIVLLSIPKSSLVQLFQLNRTLLNNFLDLISSRTHFLSERLWFMSFKTIKEKFAHYLFNLLKPGEAAVVLPKTQQELSEFFGVSRPSLARVIRDMEDEGIIRHTRKEITIADMDKLHEILD